jgi:hypothetical protein
MGVDIGTYWARIGTFIVMSPVKKTADTREVMEGNQCWFVGLVIMVLLVVGDTELNPGQTMGQEKIDHILTHVRNQEREQGDKKLLETHEIREMKNGNKELVVKFEKLSEAIMVWQSEHAVNKWKEKKQMAADKLVRIGEELQREKVSRSQQISKTRFSGNMTSLT